MESALAFRDSARALNLLTYPIKLIKKEKVDNSILSKRDQIVSDVEKIVDPKNVLSHIDEIKPYETDALAAYKQVPLMVVLPETVKEVSKILKYVYCCVLPASPQSH